MYFKWKLIAFNEIHFNEYYLLCMIIIHVFQMDIICILIKYYLNAYDHNSCI